MNRIVLIGAGKLASQLGRALREYANPDNLQVFNRTAQKAKDLARLLSCDFAEDWESINPLADLYIIAVSDASIGEVAQRLSGRLSKEALVVHTSGATPLTILTPHFEHAGVFYPLQTFASDKVADFSTIPILLDAVQSSDLPKLKDLAKQLSTKVQVASDEKRAQLHVAAVFACNFVNHNYSIAQQILEAEGLDFDLLRPLILETALLAQEKDPSASQTGPAIRNDQPTIDRHLAYLFRWPEWAELYATLTESIRKQRKS